MGFTGLVTALRRSLVLLLAIASFLVAAAAVTFLTSNYQSFSPLACSFHLKALPVGWSDRQVLEAINGVAQKSGLNLYKRSSADVGGRVFWGFIGDPQTNLAGVDGVFREFNPQWGFVVKPYEEFADYTPLGIYFSDAGADGADQVIRELKNQGFELDYKLVDEVDQLPFFLGCLWV